jgi:4-hydroxybenzoate polyprenyltransferase
VSGKNDVDWLAWWQLMRVANVFTAISNVIAGYLLTQPLEIAWLPLLLVVVSSACLYEAGMVLNDVCDAEVDARERPSRPIPSGKVASPAARIVGITLMLGGISSAIVVSIVTAQWQTGFVALLLSGSIIAYNYGIKKTQFGPMCMGACRALNVLLGASLSAEGRLADSISDFQSAWLYALGIGAYTVGISLIAKREADVARHRELILGTVSVLAGMIVVALLPFKIEFPSVGVWAWIALFSILLLLVGNILYQLLARQESPLIGPAVVALIQMFILLDAMTAALARGWPAGLAVMCLYLPMRVLSRKNPMT